MMTGSLATRGLRAVLGVGAGAGGVGVVGTAAAVAICVKVSRECVHRIC